MKTFTIHSVRNAFALFIALGLGYVAYTVSPTSVTGPKVEATSAENVSGYAWSDNIGWISFNDTTGGNPARPYGVNINTTTGDFSGEAWSGGATSTVLVDGGVGWISFDRAVTGNPPSAPYVTGISTDPIAKVDVTTGAVTGWARALAVCTQDALGNLVPAQCAQNSNAGGWDGWIKLSKDPSDTSSAYGVKIDPVTGNFSGYAWGGADTYKTGDVIPSGYAVGDSKVGTPSVIGWIKFAASGNVPAGSDDATCSGVINDYTGTTKCTYGVKWPVLISTCTNGANPPACTQCPTGFVWDTLSSQCLACNNGGCSGAGGSPSNPLGSLTCKNGAGTPPQCADCPALQKLDVSGSCVTAIGDGTCGPGENLTNSPSDCKPKTKFWQF